jgi:hypothetical protein
MDEQRQDDQQGPREHLFSVRIWQEVDHATSLARWRGMVRHGATNRSRYFTRPQELLEFLDAMTHTGMRPD